MPPKLRKAHQALDRAMDRLYRRTAFASERERVEHLFMRYEEIRAPLPAAAAPRQRVRRSPGSRTGGKLRMRQPSFMSSW